MLLKRWAGNINFQIGWNQQPQFQFKDYVNLTIAGFPILVLRKWDWFAHSVSQWDLFVLGFIFTRAISGQLIKKRQRTFTIQG